MSMSSMRCLYAQKSMVHVNKLIFQIPFIHLLCQALHLGTDLQRVALAGTSKMITLSTFMRHTVLVRVGSMLI